MAGNGYANVEEILADGKDAIAKKHGGGLAIVGALGEKVLAANDVSELPAGVGGTSVGAATTSTAGVVKKAAAVTALPAMTGAAAAGTTPTKAEHDALVADITNLRTTLSDLIAKLKTAGVVT